MSNLMLISGTFKASVFCLVGSEAFFRLSEFPLRPLGSSNGPYQLESSKVGSTSNLGVCQQGVGTLELLKSSGPLPKGIAILSIGILKLGKVSSKFEFLEGSKLKLSSC